MEVSSLPRRGGFALPGSRRLLGASGDERLVDQVRRGNHAAFEVIYDRHHRGILAFARHMLASPEEAEDVVQHTFAQAYASMRATTQALRLKAWLYTIARNRCLSILRGRREQTVELREVPVAGLGEQVQQRSELRALLHDMRLLPDDQRAALVLSELGDLSHAEIASIIGCEPVKIKALVFQARSSLIDARAARELPCVEIREQLATLRGGALRRAPLRRHVAACPGCAQFQQDVRRQRRMVALLLPVAPTVGLKRAALAAVGIGGGGGSGGAAVGGGIAAKLCGGAAGKMAAAALATGALIGGGVVISHELRHHPSAEAATLPPPPRAQAASGQRRSALRRTTSHAIAAGRGAANVVIAPGRAKRASPTTRQLRAGSPLTRVEGRQSARQHSEAHTAPTPGRYVQVHPLPPARRPASQPLPQPAPMPAPAPARATPAPAAPAPQQSATQLEVDKSHRGRGSGGDGNSQGDTGAPPAAGGGSNQGERVPRSQD